MKVYEFIAEQPTTQIPAIESMDALRKAFTEDQWRNIIMHFLKPELDTAASVEDREYQIDRAQASFGSKSNPLSPIEWYSRAVKQDIRFPKAPGSWQEIYDTLKPHAKTEVTLKAVPVTAPLATNRKETLQDIAAWVKTPVTEFVKRDDLTKYLKDWFEVLKSNKRSDRWVKVYGDTGAEGTNQAKRARDNILTKISQQFDSDKKISKKDVDIMLFSLLRTLDTIISNRIQNAPT
jgi:hypothetical protein